VISTGVREILRAALGVVCERGDELWLPNDVYPVYWDLARAAGLSPLPFTTLPTPDWSFLERTARNAIALMPMPLSPLGRWLSGSESQLLVDWLAAHEDRVLIVDAVYTYDFEASRRALDPLVETHRCVVLWSCAKSWLAPGALGVARIPLDWAPRIRDSVPSPDADRLHSLLGLLEGTPELPRRQAQHFRHEWSRLEPRIRSADPKWRAPTSGYFGTVALPFQALVQDHGILSIPASVFGSEREDVSVLSCLRDLANPPLEAASP
jgi:DNA-binding transcriptional MocR family regulator